MAASRDLRSHVTDVVTCPICLELFNTPKSLPCLHTFCLKCIEGHCRDNEPGDEVACPVCRQKFNIPQSGVTGLVSNFFIAGLVEARKTVSDVAIQVPCEVCLLECDNDASKATVATTYCVDCSQKLCDRCSTPHKRWKGGPHKVVPIGSEVETELIQTQGGKCDRHKDEYVKLFCFDDKINICYTCFAEEHQQHKCKNVNAVADECVKQMDTDLLQVETRADGARTEISRLDEERDKFTAKVEYVMEQIVETGEELKRLIDAQVNELMLEVQSVKTETCKEIESRKDTVEMELLTFETFRAYCSELKLKGKPCDITRAANDLHTRATELLQNDVPTDVYCAPTITFSPMDIHELLDAGQNFIGKIRPNDSTLTSSLVTFVTCREKNLEQQITQSAATECSLRQQIESCKSQLSDNDKMWTQKVNELQQQQVKQLEQQETEMKADNVKSEKRTSELLTQCEQLRNSESELKIKLDKSETELKRCNVQLEQLRASENSLKVELKAAKPKDREQTLKEYQEKVPHVVHTLPGAEPVHGVTSLDDELFVLRSNKDKEQVAVYNTTTTTTTTRELYSLVRRLSLPGVKGRGLWDMTSCKHYRCLYIADYSYCCVHRVELNGDVTKLSVNNTPYGLSVTSQFTVLVTCRSKLIELTTEGKQLRVINLQSDIFHPLHAIQLSNGQFVVSHGDDDCYSDSGDRVHRVCIVDTNGHVTQSYRGPEGSATVGELDVPYHLAVDKDEFIFVADYSNSRVLLLSPTLSFVREIVSRDQLNGKPPWRLFLDVDRPRLYVADDTSSGGQVVVVQMLTDDD